MGVVMTRFRVAVAVGLCAVPAFASSPDPKDLAIPPAEASRARTLVQKLGSDLITAGGRVLAVTALGDDATAARARAYAALQQIEFTGMHYRRDIGARA